MTNTELLQYALRGLEQELYNERSSIACHTKWLAQAEKIADLVLKIRDLKSQLPSPATPPITTPVLSASVKLVDVKPRPKATDSIKVENSTVFDYEHIMKKTIAQRLFIARFSNEDHDFIRFFASANLYGYLQDDRYLPYEVEIIQCYDHVVATQMKGMLITNTMEWQYNKKCNMSSAIQLRKNVPEMFEGIYKIMDEHKLEQRRKMMNISK
ncbi:hypothetical protein V0242_18570 [Aeromonas hydrophila]|uniref:hypothetical protein n=1 Tax=Aeromonas hydrophila TaxID=644 RepID=UPI002ED451A6|nr:hypothetical protein V0242_18570 [Aeromonas hydrophila]